MSASSTVGQKRIKCESNEPQNIKKNKTVHFTGQTVDPEDKLKQSEYAYNELNQYKNSLVEELSEKTAALNNLDKQMQKMKKENDDLKEKVLIVQKDFRNAISSSRQFQAKYEALGRRFQDMERVKKENDELKQKIIMVEMNAQQRIMVFQSQNKSLMRKNQDIEKTQGTTTNENALKKENDELKQRLAKAEATIKSDKKKIMALVNIDYCG